MMKRMVVIAVVVLVGMLHSVPALCAKAEAVAARNYNVEFYDRWADLPTDTLMARGLHYLRSDNPRQQQRDSALVCYSIVANRYYEGRQSTEERDRSLQAMNNIGYLYFYYYYDYQQSYNWLQRALALAQRHGNDVIRTYALLNLGNLMSLMSRMEGPGQQRSLDYYRQAWDSAIKTREWRLAMIIADNICGIAEHDPAVIDTLQRQMAGLSIPASTPLYAYVSCQLRILQCIRARDYRQALALCDSSEAHIDAPDTPERYQIGNWSMRAHIYSLMGNNQQVLHCLDQAMALAQQHHTYDHMVDIERSYWQYYQDRGDSANAHLHHMAYLAKKDSLVNQSNLTKAGELYFLNQLQAVNSEVERVAHSRRMLWWAIAGLLAVIAAIAALLYKLHNKNKRLEEGRQMMYQRMQQEIAAAEANANSPKYIHSSLDDTTKDDLASRIAQVMQDTEAICNPDFSRDTLAQMVGTTAVNVSQVISERFDKNFSQLLNEYRIREACRRFSDQQHYGKLTIEAVAASVGIKSRTSFIANFKKHTGLTPSEYVREARNRS